MYICNLFSVPFENTPNERNEQKKADTFIHTHIQVSLFFCVNFILMSCMSFLSYQSKRFSFTLICNGYFIKLILIVCLKLFQQHLTNEIFDDIYSGIFFVVCSFEMKEVLLLDKRLTVSSATRVFYSYLYINDRQPTEHNGNINAIKITMLLCAFFLNLIVFSVNCHQELETKLKILIQYRCELNSKRPTFSI